MERETPDDKLLTGLLRQLRSGRKGLGERAGGFRRTDLDHVPFEDLIFSLKEMVQDRRKLLREPKGAIKGLHEMLSQDIQEARRIAFDHMMKTPKEIRALAEKGTKSLKGPHNRLLQIMREENQEMARRGLLGLRMSKVIKSYGMKYAPLLLLSLLPALFGKGEE